MKKYITPAIAELNVAETANGEAFNYKEFDHDKVTCVDGFSHWAGLCLGTPEQEVVDNGGNKGEVASNGLS